LLIPGLLTALLALAPAVAAHGGPPPPGSDVRGPACADVIDGDAAYTTFEQAAAPTVVGFITLAEEPCSRLKYLMVVFDATGSERIAKIRGISDPSLGPTELGFILELGPGTPDTVCVVYTTSRGGHVYDYAPDDGCVELVLDTGSPARSFH
jgi:hypothetical protein